MGCKRTFKRVGLMIGKSVGAKLMNHIAGTIVMVEEIATNETMTGKEKFRAVRLAAKIEAKRLGRSISDSALNTAIEGTVFALKEAGHQVSDIGERFDNELAEMEQDPDVVTA